VHGTSELASQGSLQVEILAGDLSYHTVLGFNFSTERTDHSLAQMPKQRITFTISPHRLGQRKYRFLFCNGNTVFYFATEIPFSILQRKCRFSIMQLKYRFLFCSGNTFFYFATEIPFSILQRIPFSILQLKYRFLFCNGNTVFYFATEIPFSILQRKYRFLFSL
jgi:hypothetical protein